MPHGMGGGARSVGRSLLGPGYDRAARQLSNRVPGTDALGETSTRLAVDHIDGATETRVTEAAASFAIALRDQNRILYVTCDVDPDCTLMSSTGTPRRTTSSATGSRSRSQPSTTPPVVVERRLRRPRRSIRARRRESRERHVGPAGGHADGTSHVPGQVEHREPRSEAWSLDGAHGSLFVLSPHGPGLPVLERDQERDSFDASTGMLTMIAAQTGTAGVRGEGGCGAPLIFGGTARHFSRLADLEPSWRARVDSITLAASGASRRVNLRPLA